MLGQVGPPGTFQEKNSPAHCQWEGKGEFKKVHISLRSNGEFDICAPTVKGRNGEVWEKLGVFGAAVRKPKSVRGGHMHAFRLDAGGKKFIISLTSADKLAARRLRQWNDALREGSGGMQRAASQGSFTVADRGAPPVGLICPMCSIGQDAGYKFCRGCGAEAIMCTTCGSGQKPGYKFCTGCGSKAEDAAALFTLDAPHAADDQSSVAQSAGATSLFLESFLEEALVSRTF